MYDYVQQVQQEDRGDDEKGWYMGESNRAEPTTYILTLPKLCQCADSVAKTALVAPDSCNLPCPGRR